MFRKTAFNSYLQMVGLRMTWCTAGTGMDLSRFLATSLCPEDSNLVDTTILTVMWSLLLENIPVFRFVNFAGK